MKEIASQIVRELKRKHPVIGAVEPACAVIGNGLMAFVHRAAQMPVRRQPTYANWLRGAPAPAVRI